MPNHLDGVLTDLHLRITKLEAALERLRPCQHACGPAPCPHTRYYEEVTSGVLPPRRRYYEEVTSGVLPPRRVTPYPAETGRT